MAVAETGLEKGQRAGLLRLAGYTNREIALALGISERYASDLANDPDRTRARYRRELYALRHGGRCVDCGKLLRGHADHTPQRCNDCNSARRQEPTFWETEGRKPERRFTDDQMLDHLRRCHVEQGRVSSNAYLKYKSAHPEAPTIRAHMIRFGTWWDAVTRAGFRPGPVRRGPGRFPRVVCLEAVRTVAAATSGKRPSIGVYDRHRAAHPELGLPCSAMVRGWFDNSWIAAVEAALNDATPAEREGHVTDPPERSP